MSACAYCAGFRGSGIDQLERGLRRRGFSRTRSIPVRAGRCIPPWPFRLVLFAMSFAGSIFVGFTSRILKDEDREWLSRAGAWLLLFVMCWTGICALVLILPTWAFTLPVWGKSVLGGGWRGGGIDQRTRRFKLEDEGGNRGENQRRAASEIDARVACHEVGGAGFRRCRAGSAWRC